METIFRNEIQYIKIRILERHNWLDIAGQKKNKIPPIYKRTQNAHKEMKDIKEVKRPGGKNKKW